VVVVVVELVPPLNSRRELDLAHDDNGCSTDDEKGIAA
jgi:hypothetical protein